ncbi:MAG: nuclease, partial [Methylobacterium sp.]
MRLRIAQAVAQAGTYPVAERTLALLAEAALVPSADSLGYRVIDRTGAPRHVSEADGTLVPMDLSALLAEFRDRHPALFRPILEPEPAPAPEPVPAEDFRTATARFVESQSVLARSLVARSATRSRALATALSGRLATLRRNGVASSLPEPPAPGSAARDETGPARLGRGGRGPRRGR